MKLYRRIFAAFLFVASLLTISGIAFGQNELPKIKPGKTYKQSGAKLASPNDPDWRIVKSEKMETAFTKTSSDKKFTAFVKIAKIPVYEADRDMFVNLEKLKMAEVDETKRDSMHFYYTEYKSTPCLQYDAILNAPNTGYKHMNMNGYICRHPNDKSVIVQFEFSNYSNDRGYLKTEAALSKEFFENIQFVKLK